MKILEWLPHADGLAFAPERQAETNRTPREDPGYELSFAATQGEVREAQRLRFKVFAEEMGARLPDMASGLDSDEFDAHCEHLLVRSQSDGRVVGTYRLLPPEPARRLGRLYSESEFDLARLAHLRDTSVDHRTVETFARTRPNVTLSLLDDDHRLLDSLPRIWDGIAFFLELHD